MKGKGHIATVPVGNCFGDRMEIELERGISLPIGYLGWGLQKFRAYQPLLEGHQGCLLGSCDSLHGEIISNLLSVDHASIS